MINIGSKQLKGISVGNRAVKAVYKGSQKVWAKESWVNVSLTKYSFSAGKNDTNGTNEIISSALDVSDIHNVTFRLSGSFFGTKLSYTDTSGGNHEIDGSSFNDLIVSTLKGAIVNVHNGNSMVQLFMNNSKQIVNYRFYRDRTASLTINKIELLQ